MATLVIARLTFREAARRKILIAALVLGVVFLTVYGVGFYFIDSEMRRSIGAAGILEKSQISNFLFMAGMYVVNFLTVMMAVLTSVDTLSGEIASGTIHTLIAKPIHRREVVLGKWLGFAGMLTLYLILMAGGISLVVYLISGYTVPNLLRGISLVWMNGILLLSVSLLGGAMLSTLANGVLVFGLFGIAFVGGWIEQIGSFISNQTAINVGIISSLLIPSEALWKRAAFEMQSPLVQALGFSPFSSSSVPSLIMVIYAILYAVIAMGVAINRFQHRDL